MATELRKAIDLIDAGLGGVVGLYEARETVLMWARRVADLDWEAATQANRGLPDYTRDIVLAALGVTTKDDDGLS